MVRPTCRLSLLALLPTVAWVVLPGIACADIYKWTDERGNVVISNVLPADHKNTGKISVIAKDQGTRPLQANEPPPQKTVTPVEQMLLDKIGRLEQQLQTRPIPAQGAIAPPPPPSYFGTYNPPQPPVDYPSAYPVEYPPDYYYPVPLYSYAVYPSRFFVNRPAFHTFHAFHNGGIRNSSMHRGRR